jgi:hypothetical protein
MLLQLVSTLLIVLTTVSFAVRKGLYRSTIMFLCCLIGAVVAFSYYENVYGLLSIPFLPFYGEGVPLFLLFVIAVLVLDLLSEQFLTGQIRLPMMIDRIGGGFIGFWTGMLAVGMLCIAVQMMPWTGDVLGFERVYRDAEHKERVRHLLFRPDEFTVSLVGYLTDNIFSGSQGYRSVNPDLLLVVAQGLQPVQSESRRVIPSDQDGAGLFDVMKVMEMEDGQLGTARLRKPAPGEAKATAAPGVPATGSPVAAVTDINTMSLRPPDEGNRYLVARCKLRAEAGDDDKWQRFTLRQVRMVGQENGKPRQYFACGYRDPARMDQLARVSAPDQPVLFSGRGEYVFDLVFDVPQKFVPSFVEFKRLARAEIRGGDKLKSVPTTQIVAELKAPAPAERPGGAGGVAPDLLQKLKIPGKPGAVPTPAAPAPKPQIPVPKPAGKPTAAAGRVGGRLVESADFGPMLPFKLSRKELSDQGAEFSGSALKNGHVVVPAGDARDDPTGMITGLAVPAEFRLLQLKCDALQAKSLFGRALAGAVKTVGQYVVLDEAGRQYFPVGEYRIAPIDGQPTLELQYDAEGEPGRSIRQPKRINEPQLQEGSTVVLLYHIPPGTRLREFTAGPHALAKGDLSGTTAPN